MESHNLRLQSSSYYRSFFVLPSQHEFRVVLQVLIDAVLPL